MDQDALEGVMPEPGDVAIEKPLRERLGWVLAEYPKDRGLILLIGQHRLTEPLAIGVGLNFYEENPGKVDVEHFGEGYDYKDTYKQVIEEGFTDKEAADKRRKELSRENASREAGRMEQVAREHLDRPVFNLHETRAESNELPKDKDMRIDFMTSLQLLEDYRQEFAEFLKQLQGKLDSEGMKVALTTESVASQRIYGPDNRHYLADVPANSVVVEFYTPADVYKSDEEGLQIKGNTQLDSSELGGAQAAMMRYSEVFNEVLPVVNAKYKELLAKNTATRVQAGI